VVGGGVNLFSPANSVHPALSTNLVSMVFIFFPSGSEA
jgi:hypothetical protein